VGLAGEGAGGGGPHVGPGVEEAVGVAVERLRQHGAAGI
jgi:hypothetical protein